MAAVSQERKDRDRQLHLLKVLHRVALGCDPTDLPPEFADVTLEEIRRELHDITVRLVDIEMRRPVPHWRPVLGSKCAPISPPDHG